MADKIFDLHNVDEDSRIKLIGERATEGKIVGVMIDDDVVKIERYIKKITTRYPKVIFIDQIDGLVEGVVTLRFGPLTS